MANPQDPNERKRQGGDPSRPEQPGQPGQRPNDPNRRRDQPRPDEDKDRE
jgi:hypothetical protein